MTKKYAADVPLVVPDVHRGTGTGGGTQAEAQGTHQERRDCDIAALSGI